ncbi:MAG: hypothetical protein EXS31_14970 [Pedosphaera sp.]|nr:hypothetical protein [Pedosphaera sp.]
MVHYNFAPASCSSSLAPFGDLGFDGESHHKTRLASVILVSRRNEFRAPIELIRLDPPPVFQSSLVSWRGLIYRCLEHFADPAVEGSPNMKLGIRSKFIGILAIASLLPLVFAITAVLTVGYSHLRTMRGVMFAAAAGFSARTLRMLSENQVGDLNDLIALTDLHHLADEVNRSQAAESSAAAQARMRALDARWQKLAADDPELRRYLENPIAQRLREFQSRHPMLKEIFVTDALGGLAGTTEKTSDFLQSDKKWWQEAAKLRSGQSWLDELYFHESAGVFSLDICVPIRLPETTDGPISGVLKAVLNVSALFDQIVPDGASQDTSIRILVPQHQVVTSDG